MAEIDTMGFGIHIGALGNFGGNSLALLSQFGLIPGAGLITSVSNAVHSQDNAMDQAAPEQYAQAKQSIQTATAPSLDYLGSASNKVFEGLKLDSIPGLQAAAASLRNAGVVHSSDGAQPVSGLGKEAQDSRLARPATGATPGSQ